MTRLTVTLSTGCLIFFASIGCSRLLDKLSRDEDGAASSASSATLAASEPNAAPSGASPSATSSAHGAHATSPSTPHASGPSCAKSQKLVLRKGKTECHDICGPSQTCGDNIISGIEMEQLPEVVKGEPGGKVCVCVQHKRIDIDPGADGKCPPDRRLTTDLRGDCEAIRCKSNSDCPARTTCITGEDGSFCELSGVAPGPVDAKTFLCGGARCRVGQTCCSDPTHAATCFTPALIPDWCLTGIAKRGGCDPKTNEPCAAGQKCCLLSRPPPRAMNPLCMESPESDDCTN